MVLQQRVGKGQMNDNNPQPDFLTPAQVVTRWNAAVTTGTLANWRSKRTGPPFQKFGTKVRYPMATLVAWEKVNHHQAGLPANDNTEKINAA